jgi:hypothetical protein
MQVEAVFLRAQRALGHGTVVGVENDPYGLALVGRTGGRSAGGGRGQQTGQQRIFLAHGLVADDGDFTVARRGHEGDDFAALEETQDALARATHDGLDLLLRGCGRRVKHPAIAITIGRVDTIEKNGVKMRVESEVAVGALDDRHGAGLAGRQAALSVPPPVRASDCVREDAHYLAEQFPVEGEREAQGEGHGQNPLSDRDPRQYMIREVQRPLAHPPAETTWTHGSGFAAEGHDMVLAAAVAVQAGEASPQDPAVHEPV